MTCVEKFCTAPLKFWPSPASVRGKNFWVVKCTMVYKQKKLATQFCSYCLHLQAWRAAIGVLSHGVISQVSEQCAKHLNYSINLKAFDEITNFVFNEFHDSRARTRR